MRTAQRIKGQEVSVLITSAGQLQDTLTDIQSFNFEAQLEVKSMGYIGEKTNRKDDIFNGVKFDMELHLHKQDWFNFQQAIINRAKRVTPDLVINITAVASFPNGDTPTVLLPDCKFGAQPLNVTSRGDYVKVKLEGECDDMVVQTS